MKIETVNQNKAKVN